MSADILTNIQNDIHAFSKGQKKIAAYILSNYDKAAFMTASRLGKTVEVSESTVVRFAVELGYEGYPEMQKTDHLFQKPCPRHAHCLHGAAAGATGTLPERFFHVRQHRQPI